MGLFNKKKEETNSCCCVGNCTPKTMAKTEASKSGVGVKVLGSGCVKCKTLENATREALSRLFYHTSKQTERGQHFFFLNSVYTSNVVK